MCWQCETRDDDIVEHLDEIRDAVRQHGWVIKCVDDTKRPYAYTAGLHQYGWPELIATGGPLRPEAHPDAHLGLAVALFGTDIRAVQLVWTDLSGHWPLESTFDDELPQPVLGVRAEAA